MLLDEVENVLFLECNVKLSQQRQVLMLKRSTSVMLFLILNITYDSIQLRMTVEKAPYPSCQLNLP